MRVDGLPMLGRTVAGRAKPARGGFHLPDAPGAASGPEEAAPVTLGLLAPGPQPVEARPDEPRRRAGQMLDALGDLQHALLGGAVDDQALGRLAALAEAPVDAGSDPALAEIVTAVRLRVAVELARRGIDTTDP